MNRMSRLRVLVWGENVHERENALVQKIYPDGMHQTIAEGIAEKDEFDVQTATLHDQDHGLTEESLHNIDVLVWWGHAAHGRVNDEAVQRVVSSRPGDIFGQGDAPDGCGKGIKSKETLP